MTDKVIGFIIILFLIIILNVKDFINLLNDRTDRYIQRYSGMLSSLVGLMYYVLKYDLRNLLYLHHILVRFEHDMFQLNLP